MDSTFVVVDGMRIVAEAKFSEAVFWAWLGYVVIGRDTLSHLIVV